MGLFKAPNNNREQKNLLKSRFEAGMDQFLGYNLMISPGLIAMKDGALSASYEYYGPDVDSSTDNELDMHSSSIVNLLRHFGSGWMIEFNPDRSMSRAYPHSSWPDSVSELIDLERRVQYQAEGVHFDTHFYLTITHMPEEMRNKSKKQQQFFEDHSDTAPKDEKHKLDKIEKQFEDDLEKMEKIIGRTLGLRRLEGSELLSHRHFCISGAKQKVAMPKFPIELDCYLAQNFVAGIQPKVNDKYISVITISEFPEESYPDFMGFILQLPIEFRWSMRYVTLSRDESRNYLKKYRKDWRKKAMGFLGMIRSGAGNSHAIQYDEDANEMVAGIDDSIKANNGDIIRYGFLSNTIVIMDADLRMLEEKTKTIKGQLEEKGFMVIRETLNASEAYLGSIPSHGYYNVRRPLMDSIFVSHAAPISRIWQGEEIAPCDLSGYKDQPALFYSATSGSTPFRFNLHVRDVGHAILIGPTGSGKSTYLGLIMAQHRKYPNSRIYVLDKNYSSRGLIRSLNGNYIDPNGEQSVSFAPLAHIDVPQELEWACGFIESMLVLRKVHVSSEMRQSIRSALESLRRSPKEFWSIEHLITLCDKEIRASLSWYVESGEANRLLGGSKDSIEIGSIMGIEMGFLAEADIALTGPLLAYLFHMLSRKFKEGHPSLLILDEAWFFMRHSLIGEKIEDWLKTLRKLNVSVIMASQSCSDILNSGMKDAIIESCLTKVFLPNPAININDESQMSYQQLGLNSRQVGIIKYSTPKQHYYVTSPKGQRLIDLGLGEVSKAFLANSDLDGAKLAQLAYTNENWVYDWLMAKAADQKNVEKRERIIEWANYWLTELKGERHEAA